MASFIKQLLGVDTGPSTKGTTDDTRANVLLTGAKVKDWGKTTREKASSQGKKFSRGLRSVFLTGLRVIIPLGITIFILVWIFDKIDNVLQPIFISILGRKIPGIGLLTTLVLILIAGAIMGTFLGRRLMQSGEGFISKIPIVRSLYGGIKQISDSFSAQDQEGFLRVVLIEFPRAGMKTIAFVTDEYTDEADKLKLNVFIPTAPNPTSGFLQIVDAEDVTPTNMSVDDALKMVMSAGKVSAKGLGKKKQVSPPDVL
jgi:uncharacterized membrane protein